MKSFAEITVAMVNPEDDFVLRYKCPHCCTGGEQVVETRPFELLSKYAKAIVEHDVVNYTCPNCGGDIALIAGDAIKNTLKPWI
ncbi:MAG: hypothetical protein PVH62_05095 [Anaerolineae bacterium]|jgi:hypothetical protein